MAMTLAATVAGQIVSDLGISGTAGASRAQQDWVKILMRIQTMISAGTVTVTVATTDTVPAVGLVAPAGGGPVTGAAAGTGVGTGTGSLV